MVKRYSSYKDSRVEWIGEIPSSWSLSKVGRHFYMGRGRVISKEEISDNSGVYPVYSSQTSNNGELGKINTFDFDGEYVTWTTDGANTGTCFYRKGKFNTTNVCGMLSIKNIPYSLEFLNFYLNQVTKPYVRLDINPKLMNNMMGEIPLVIPPLSEQQQIVSYLDEKTSLIDTLIQSKQKKITLLKEKRTSLINQVVTKGLNPDVKMKDSGVEWIGEIPSGWESIPLKRMVQIGNGRDYKHIEVEEGGYPVLGTGGVFSRCSEYLHDRSSVLLGRKGTIDKPLFIEEPFWTSDTIYYTVIDESKVIPKLLYHLVHQIPFNLFSYGSTIPSMTKSDYEEMKFPLPPLHEQQQIVDYLDRETELIDKTVSLEERKIELLKEYKQSLISEVVTGKRKVVSDE